MCISAIAIKNKRTDEMISVPCGKCPQCLARRISGWSFRLMQEDKISESSYFVTLTYEPKTVPITKAGYMSLSKRHLQLFFKRLRKNNSNKLKYYAVGEYGTQGMRPHYHMLLFNAVPGSILPAWQQGHIDIGTVTCASVGYTLKYMCKPRRIPYHRNDDRIPEFALMSKDLGLIISLLKCYDGIRTIY